MENGKLVGIISDRDICQNASPFLNTEQERDIDRSLLHKSIADIMSTHLITIDRSTSVDCASILLLENNSSCLPIIDEDDMLEGILTWKDILYCHTYAAE